MAGPGASKRDLSERFPIVPTRSSVASPERKERSVATEQGAHSFRGEPAAEPAADRCRE